MQVQTFRGAADGLIPAGAFFAQLAAKLEDANTQAARRRAELDEDRALEAIYRKRSAARSQYGASEHHAMMWAALSRRDTSPAAVPHR